MWFYIRNLSSSLPLRTPGPPVKRSSWNSKGGGGDQVNFLLGEIERLKADLRCFCDCALVDAQDPAAAVAG